MFYASGDWVALPRQRVDASLFTAASDAAVADVRIELLKESDLQLFEQNQRGSSTALQTYIEHANFSS